MVAIYIIKTENCEGEHAIGYTGDEQVAKDYVETRAKETGYIYWYETMIFDPNTKEIEDF